MPQIRETDRGTFVQEAGRWRLVTPQEQALIDEPGGRAAGRAFLLNMQQGLQLLNMGALSQARGQMGEEARDDAVDSFGQTQAELTRLETFSPLAGQLGFQGSLIADPLNILGGPVAGGARRGAQRGVAAGANRLIRGKPKTMPQRVETAIEGAGDAARTIQAAGTELRSVGGAEVVERGGVPGLFDLIFTEGAPMTPQQLALVETGEQVGFHFLPGQVSGNRMFLETLQSTPVGRQMFAFELEGNAESLRRHVVRMLDLPPETPMTRGILAESRRVLGERFEAVRKTIGDLDGGRIALDPDDIALLDTPEFRSVLTPRQRGSIDLADMSPGQMMEVRSRLNNRATQFYRNGENQAGNDVVQVIESLDNQLDDALLAAGKVDTMEDWRKVRQQWRVRLALQKPGVITPDGDVSLKRLTGNLEKVFEREFGETLLVPEAFRTANPEIAEGLDFIRVARSFASNMPDSGTATRQFAGDVLTSPTKAFKQAATARMLRKMLDMSTPE
jgi:hypothetical protein